MDNWIKLTKEINSTRDKQQEEKLLLQLFGGHEYWILAQIVCFNRRPKSNNYVLKIRPVYILHNDITDMTAFTYDLINNFLEPDDKDIVKILTEEERKIISSIPLIASSKYNPLTNKNKYYKLRINLLEENLVSFEKDERFSFMVETMVCVGDNIGLQQFFEKDGYEVNENNILYRLLNDKEITNNKFLFACEENIKKAFEEHLKIINEKKEALYKAELEDKIQKHKQEVEESIKRITNNQKLYLQQIEETRKEKLDLEDQLKDVRNELECLEKEFKEKKEFLKRYNICLTTEKLQCKNIDTKTPKSFDYFQDMIDYAQKYLKNDKEKLSYSKDILRSFYLGLQTNQLIMLMGKPGTGKTSLVRKVAEMFGFDEAAIIPVQSNWSDKGDLLGYYNPLEKSYITTPFLENLLKFNREAVKEENKDKLYFICLDEMNLAHIEYYFAEFLSVLQSNDKKLRLYGKKIKENILLELKYNGFSDELIDNLHEEQIAGKLSTSKLSISEKQYYLSLCRMADMIVNIPDEIEISERIKFIGTLNQDATTLDLSPKVLDRAFIIRMNSKNKDNIELKDGENYLEKIVYKPIEKYNANDKGFNESIEISEIVSMVSKIVYISNRVLKQTFENGSFDSWCKVLGQKDAIDLLLATSIIPHVKISSDDYENKVTIINNLKNIYHFDIVNDIFNEIDDPDEQELDYWRS